MRRTVLGSWTKFWPSVLVGRTPSRAASWRISAGPSRAVTGQRTGDGCADRPGRRAAQRRCSGPGRRCHARPAHTGLPGELGPGEVPAEHDRGVVVGDHGDRDAPLRDHAAASMAAAPVAGVPAHPAAVVEVPAQPVGLPIWLDATARPVASQVAASSIANSANERISSTVETMPPPGRRARAVRRPDRRSIRVPDRVARVEAGLTHAGRRNSSARQRVLERTARRSRPGRSRPARSRHCCTATPHPVGTSVHAGLFCEPRAPANARRRRIGQLVGCDVGAQPRRVAEQVLKRDPP